MKAFVALLLVLNIGFAAWQLTRHEVPLEHRPPADADIEPLRLLSEQGKSSPATTPVQISEPAAPVRAPAPAPALP